MSANVLWRVRVLRLVEDIIEVSAVTESGALEEAEACKGVARAMGIVGREEEQ